MCPQTIIDLDAAVPDDVKVKLKKKTYLLPGDISIPRLLQIERLVSQLEDPEGAGGGVLEELYEEVLDLFRIRQPDLEELDVGPRLLGQLIVRLYTTAADSDDEAGGERPTRASTRSTSPKKRSRGSKS